MTQSEKALKSILSIYKPSKKIIKQQVDINLPTEIQTDMVIDTPKKIEAIKKQKEQPIELDDNEKQFIDKYIEYSELTLLNASAQQLIATFEKALGQNASKAIQALGKKTQQRNVTIKQLAKELNSLKEQIYKQTEKARAKATLISLAETIPVEQPKEKKSSKKQEKQVVINSESKKKTKKK